MKNLKSDINAHLQTIYKDRNTDALAEKIMALIEAYGSGERVADREKWNEQDIILITYGDSIRAKDEVPLQTLRRFLEEYLGDCISTVHILPFFPYSSDDGFSVVDYLEVNPELGNWEDVKAIGRSFSLMFDLVINHISVESSWFRKYLRGIAPYDRFFIEEDPSKDLSEVVRPRSLPLLTRFETNRGYKYVWTTFSPDQVDLNFRNPKVLLEMCRTLLFYLNKGARIIRLDAITYLWKEDGTKCVHLPETHEVVKLMRTISEAYDAGSIILTETNVPNLENLSYFGQGDEAHMIYQFSLPPLLLHALWSGNAAYLRTWSSSLHDILPECTYFNFTASHDGIGVRPLEGLLPQDELDKLVEYTRKAGGLVSTHRRSDGTDVPYELNITYFSAMKATKEGPDNHQVDRFLCSQTIVMVMKGIPAFYIHNFTATENYHAGVEQTGRARSINRRHWDDEEVRAILSAGTPREEVFRELKRRIRIRRQQSAFHPYASQETLDLADSLFGIVRESEEQRVICVSNISNMMQETRLQGALDSSGKVKDLLSGKEISTGSAIRLQAYETVWLEIK